MFDPTYKKCFMGVDNANEVLRFVAFCPDGIEELEAYTGEEVSCKPQFVLFNCGREVGKVVGCDAPLMERLIFEMVPAVEEDD